jgi:hypothetical protein
MKNVNEANENVTRNYEDTVKALLRVTMRYAIRETNYVDGVPVQTVNVYDVKRINKDQVVSTTDKRHYYYYVMPLDADGAAYDDERIQAETRRFNDAVNKRLHDARIADESNNETVLTFVASLPDTLNAPVQDGDPRDSQFQNIQVAPIVRYRTGYTRDYADGVVTLTLAYDYDEERNPVHCRAYTPGYADGKIWRTWDSPQIKRTADKDSGKVYRLTFDGIEYVTDYEVYMLLGEAYEDAALYAELFNVARSEGRIELYVKPEDKVKSLPPLASLNGKTPEPGKLYRLF